MVKPEIQESIIKGRTVMGIEFGSTRIKTVLINENHLPIASGSFEWENRFENGFWTYDIEDIWVGLQSAFQNLRNDVLQKTSILMQTVGTLGISAMMHGYMAFDRNENLLVPFRTWRNTNTSQAVKRLTELFGYNIPQRWSIAHLYQSILNNEPHVHSIHYLTTLAGFVHWKLTGQKVLGIGDASGMFPIDCVMNDYDARLIGMINEELSGNNINWKLEEILPNILVAGEVGGFLSDEGAKIIDPTGEFKAGVPLCPPEGDASTGMVATNSISARTGNVSAGTSVFAMIVLEKALSRMYPEIDIVTTPTGKPVAMVHCNNFTSDLNAWIDLFYEFTLTLGIEINKSSLFEKLYRQALLADIDGGRMLSYAYFSGEHIIHLSEGCPLFIRTSESRFTLANFMRTHLFSSLGVLKIGMDILIEQEKVQIDQLLGHGGFFKTPEVGQKIMAAAMNVPVSVMKTAGEGGSWGISLLATYMLRKDENESLEAYLANKVFACESSITIDPNPEDIAGFTTFMERYRRGLDIERVAIECMR